MKCEFWFDLPEALCNINQRNLSIDDAECCKMLRITHSVYFLLTIRNMLRD